MSVVGAWSGTVSLVYSCLISREGDNWGDLGVDGWIILGWISRRWDVGNGLDWDGPG